MIEVHPSLWVGDQTDALTTIGKTGWFVVSAAKYPWHRDAVGYTTKAAPKDDPEYLMALRGRHLALNLVDVPDPAYIPPAVINAALATIEINLADPDTQVLVHCNQGASRAPTIGLLFMRKFTDRFADKLHWEAVQEFKRTYPAYAPAAGMDGYAKQHWDD